VCTLTPVRRAASAMLKPIWGSARSGLGADFGLTSSTL
jgi:hypothetical protein